MALGAFATVASELVRTGAELVSRIWIEQAKGVLAASQEVTPDEGFQQFRARARSSSRKLADLVREVVVQKAQRERVAAKAWMTLGCGRPRRAPGRPSKTCRRPRPGWPGARPPRTGPRTTWPRESGRRPARAARR
jgi:hypothetical protein